MSRAARAPCWLALSALSLLGACAALPKERYGIESLRFRGVSELDPDALRACLATEQRDKVTLGLGVLGSPVCGEPPFDEPRRSARLFAFPWKEWPVYDESLLKLDLARLERWYEARGYYGVKVLDVSFDPSDAAHSEDCRGDGDCSLELTIRVQEGEPVRIRALQLDMEGQLAPALREALHDALTLEPGAIFDEALYDREREALAKVLREEGYARARIAGSVVVNRGLHVADLKLTVTPGPLCHIGEVRVANQVDVPTAPVLAATLLRKGQLYRESELEDAERAIYALGAFSTVTVRGRLDDGEGSEIPIEIELEPRRESQIMLGAGLLAGTVSSGAQAEEGVSVRQWDVHLLASYEHRNFFGGLRRFRVEDRPRMLFLGPFPSTPEGSPRFGNTFTANFSQPGKLDPRTSLFVETRWDSGPDPFLLFFRHDVGLALGLERGFFKQRLNARVAIHQDLMQVPRSSHAAGAEDPAVVFDPHLIPKSYRLPFFEQRLTLDLRDDAANPSRGAYFRLAVHEAVRAFDPSWNYLRVIPDVRGYLPVGLGMVLAGRFALGLLHVFDASPELDRQARELGAQSYRLRGGGANSNRGFGPGDLGDGRTGGIRRWEASLELRVPLSKSFYIVGFGDMGDVNAGYKRDRNQALVRDVRFRFDHRNTTLGGGLRYRTIIGPIRLDVGYRPRWLATKVDDDTKMDLGFKKFRGGVHLTIGESF